MTVYSFKTFFDNLIVESLHPELQNIVTTGVASKRKKQQLLADKIKELTLRGEPTGIEGNMPQGSSRAYLRHSEPHIMSIDGVPSQIPVGTKVAIRAALDKHHKAKNYDGLSLGRLQNSAENGDSYVNDRFRVLRKNGINNYSTNDEHGIFPPLIEHDPNHEWSLVGHSGDISKKDFKTLTATESHPNGISHDDFMDVLERDYNRNNGRYWKLSDKEEQRLDGIESHPLIQKFLHHQRETDTPPYDYSQIKNLGVFEHPDGSKHIVARDHGFSSQVQNAYKEARANSNKNRRTIGYEVTGF